MSNPAHYPKIINNFNLAIERIPDLDRSINRRNQLTIQPRASSRDRVILSIMSIFRLAHLSSKTVHDSPRSFSPLPFRARIIPFLLYCRLALLICPSPFLRPRRDDVAPRNARHVGTDSVSRQKYRRQWRSQRGVNNRENRGGCN